MMREKNFWKTIFNKNWIAKVSRFFWLASKLRNLDERTNQFIVSKNFANFMTIAFVASTQLSNLSPPLSHFQKNILMAFICFKESVWKRARWQGGWQSGSNDDSHLWGGSNVQFLLLMLRIVFPNK